MANGNDEDKNGVEQTRESAEENLDTRSKNLKRLKGLAEQEEPSTPPPSVGAYGPRVAIPDSEISEVQEDLETNQVDLLSGDIRRRRAEAQGLIESSLKETAKLVPEVPLTAGEYIGHMLDMGSWNAAWHGAKATAMRMMNYSQDAIENVEEGANYEEAGNAFTKAMRENRQAVESSELLGIDWETFRQDPTDTFDWDDPTWYTQSLSDVARSVLAFGGIGSAAGAATRGGLGMLARAAGGGQKAMKFARGVAQGMTSAELGLAEGAVQAHQTYKKIYEDSLKAHLEQGKTRSEAERLAKKAAGQGAATTMGQNAAIIGALSYTTLIPAFRSPKGIKSLGQAGLNRKSGETVQEWITRASNSGMPPQITNNLARYARESGFESIEELGAQLAAVEGEYRGQQIAGIADASTLGDRIADQVLNDEGAFAATMGAIGGAGQRGLIRNLPLHQRVTDEGETELASQATLEAERNMQRFQEMKKAIKNRGRKFVEWQQKLKEGSESGSDQQIREAQEGMIDDGIIDSFRTGTEEQIRKAVEEIASLSEEEANNRGFETDEDSPYHYEKLAEEYLDQIESLKGVWNKYQNDFNYTKEEKAVNLPHQLFNIEAKIRSLGRKEGRVDEDLDRVQSDIDQLPDGAKGEEVDLGNMASEVNSAKMIALQEVVKQLDEQDKVPSDFESLEQLKDAVDYEGIRSRLLEESTSRLQEASPGEGPMEFTDVESFSNFLKSDFETDLIEMIDLIPESSDTLMETMENIKEDSDSRTYQATTGKDASRILEAEIRKQGLRNKQKLYRDQLNYLETSKGRSDYMERIKEQQAKDTEEWINNRKSEISDLQTVEEVQEYRNQLSVNSEQVLEDSLSSKEEELKTREKESVSEDTESDTEPTQPNQQDTREAAAPSPQESKTPVEDLDFDPEEGDQERTEQKAQDEPTGPSEPTQTTETEPSPQTAPTPQDAPTPQEGPEPSTEPEAEPQPESSGVLGDIRSRARNREAELPNIIRKRVNNMINELPPPDKDNENAPDSVEEWVSTANSMLDNIQAEMESLARSPQYDMDIEAVREVIESRREQLPSEAENKAMNRNVSETESVSGEPKNVGSSQEEAQRDFTEENTEALSPKIGNRSATVNYRSRPFERDEDGNIIETSNERVASFDKLVETPIVNQGTDVEYRIESTVYQSPSKLREDIRKIENSNYNNDSELIESAKIEVYAMVEGGEIRVGAIPLPQNINPENTKEFHNGDQNNIDTQKLKTRKNRAKILLAQAQNPEGSINGKITNKRTGHLSVKYTEESLGTQNPEKDVRSLSEAFSEDAFGGDGVQLYVLKDGQAYVSENARRSVTNDFSGDHATVEGSVGMVLPTPNGKNVAVPLHVPRIGEVNGLTGTIYDILTDEEMTPSEKEAELKKYVFLRTGGSNNAFKNPNDPEKPRIMVTDNGVVIGRNLSGSLYSTDSGFQNRTRGGRISNNIEGNREQVMQLIDEMHLNVNLERVNRNESMTPGKHDEGFLSQFGEDLTYDEFLRQQLETDILEVTTRDFNDEVQHIYFEQSTIQHQPKIEQNEQAGPSQQGASTREHRTPVNKPPEETRVEREVQPVIASMNDQELADAYSDTLDEMNTAASEANPSLYNSLRERVKMLREEAERRDSINSDSLPPLPDQAEFVVEPSPEERGEADLGGVPEEVARFVVSEQPLHIQDISDSLDISYTEAARYADWIVDSGAAEYVGEYQLHSNVDSFSEMRNMLSNQEQQQQETQRTEIPTDLVDKFESYGQEGSGIRKFRNFEDHFSGYNTYQLYQEQDSINGEFERDISDVRNSIEFWAVEDQGTTYVFPRPLTSSKFDRSRSVFEGRGSPGDRVSPATLTREGDLLVVDQMGAIGEENISQQQEETTQEESIDTDRVTSEFIEAAENTPLSDNPNMVEENLPSGWSIEKVYNEGNSTSNELLSGNNTFQNRIEYWKITDDNGESFVVPRPQRTGGFRNITSPDNDLDFSADNDAGIKALPWNEGNPLSSSQEITEQQTEEEVELEPVTEKAENIEDEEFDPESMDLANMQDPQAREWWRNASMREIADHFEDIYNEGRHNEGDQTLLSHLRDEVFADESWTYETMGGDVLRTRLQDQAEDMPSSTPSDYDQEVDEEVAQGSRNRWMGEADFSPARGYTRPVEVDNGVKMSQRNFEEIVSELQSDGELQITCRA